MTGRPSGRCAATEALEFTRRFKPPDGLHSFSTASMSGAKRCNYCGVFKGSAEHTSDRCEGNGRHSGRMRSFIAREQERLTAAALASPCCVTGDQEQLKEALKRAERDSWRGGHMEDVRQYRAALALLGSHEQEER